MSDSDDLAQGRDRDPGDAVPPGVAVQTPEPLSENDKKVQDKLNHLGDQQKTPG